MRPFSGSLFTSLLDKARAGFEATQGDQIFSYTPPNESVPIVEYILLTEAGDSLIFEDGDEMIGA